MEQQRILRKRFMDQLISDVKSGNSIHLFRNNEFQIDEKNTLIMPHIERPLGLLNKLNASKDGDFESAVAVYEAFKKLTPLEAADPKFWNYLALTDLYNYLKERWPNVYKRDEKTNEIKYILEHFLMKDSSTDLMRTHLSGLWWSVHLSIDQTNETDIYHLTQVMFWNQTLRTRTMGSYLLARKKEVALGFLEYCKDRGKENFGNFEKEHQELTEHLNLLGGAKPLAFYTRDEIKSILLKKFPTNK
jgi:hypothetical protein